MGEMAVKIVFAVVGTVVLLWGMAGMLVAIALGNDITRKWRLSRTRAGRERPWYPRPHGMDWR